MSERVRASSVLLPFSERAARHAAESQVLAVVGGKLDQAVIDLARVLVEEGRRHLDLLVVVEVPSLFPLRAYGEHLAAPEAHRALDAAEQYCGPVPGESGILLCRSMGQTLVAEVQARGIADLVIGAPTGSGWRKWRTQQAITRLQSRAHCRVYVVHTQLPPSASDLPARFAR